MTQPLASLDFYGANVFYSKVLQETDLVYQVANTKVLMIVD